MTAVGDYGMLSDCRSAALVSSAGSIDWLCLPRFDSPSVFARLLDADAGHWTMAPSGRFGSSRRYLDDSMILETTFACEGGTATLTDCLLLGKGERGHTIGMHSPHVLVRQVRCEAGAVEFESLLSARLEYALSRPIIENAAHGFTLAAGPSVLSATSSVPMRREGDDIVARFTLREGQLVWFALAWEPSFSSTEPWREDAIDALHDTTEAWRSWSALHWHEGRGYQGPHAEQVHRSALVLQGLTYQPSGAVVAAPTTSLPERSSGGWNWDYRFCWLRDSSLMMRSLWIAACPDEPQRLFEWLARAEGGSNESPVQIVFGVEGERDLNERELTHLTGFGGNQPVRIGNAAWRQRQLDVLGEVLDAALLLDDNVEYWTPSQQQLLRSFAEKASIAWHEPDFGMWELRGEPQHYTSSKVMCWVALDRGLRIAERIGASQEMRGKWERERDLLRESILTNAWSEKATAYTGSYGSDTLDASVLLMPLEGFLPASDPRMRATIDAIAEKLESGGPVRRWAQEPNGFLLAGFWLASCYAQLGEKDRAQRQFERCCSYANDLGLLSEEGDASGNQTGNFPQAFSHVGLINAAWDISTMDEGVRQQPVGAVAS